MHVELGDPRPLFDRMRALGMRVGLVHNPETPLDAVEPYLDEIDILLFMSVHPGFGGQVFILIGWACSWWTTRNFTFRLLHLAGIGFVVIESWLGARCPLTLLENHLRQVAGDSPQDMSFVGYWLSRLLFYSAPEWVFTLVYTLFAAAVITTWLVYPPRRRPSARH